MGEAETCVRFASIGGCKHEAAARRDERRRSKAVVRNDEETVGRPQETAVAVTTVSAEGALLKRQVFLWYSHCSNRSAFHHQIGSAAQRFQLADDSELNAIGPFIGNDLHAHRLRASTTFRNVPIGNGILAPRLRSVAA